MVQVPRAIVALKVFKHLRTSCGAFADLKPVFYQNNQLNFDGHGVR